MNRRVTVYGAHGHTGSFVVAELRRRGWAPVPAGREIATVDDPVSLDRLIEGSAAVINCAGPFLDTAIPLIESAIRSRVPYVDTAAEQAAVLQVFERYSNDPRAADIVIAPSMAFYGGLGDLMATAAMGEWDRADEICIAVALDHWHPTRGTRVTGERNRGKRFIFANGTLERRDPPPERTWTFPEPFGVEDVVPLTLAESIVIPRHLRTPDIRVYINARSLEELRDPNTPVPPREGDSKQIFVMDVIVRRGREERRIVARGRDIYASTAPIAVEAMERIVRGESRKQGVVAAGEAFDARDFLSALNFSIATSTPE